MLQPAARHDAKPCARSFLIDPEGKCRAILYYPLSTGATLQEIKRL
jgi:alkyl hydroperoxide reductase subunit AhpC